MIYVDFNDLVRRDAVAVRPKMQPGGVVTAEPGQLVTVCDTSEPDLRLEGVIERDERWGWVVNLDNRARERP